MRLDQARLKLWSFRCRTHWLRAAKNHVLILDFKRKRPFHQEWQFKNCENVR